MDRNVSFHVDSLFGMNLMFILCGQHKRSSWQASIETTESIAQLGDCLRLRRTGNAVKNRWNWMMSPKRKDIIDTIVMQNKTLFGAIHQVHHNIFLDIII